jgi:hypothetical protein
MSCNPPLTVNLATYDESLYNFSTNSFIWSGTLYWSVHCLVDNHVSVSNRIPPRFSKDQFLPFTSTPSQPWNFCKSINCQFDTDTFLLILSFNPESTRFDDYLQFVFSQDGAIFDSPRHSITDNNGKQLRLDISHVSLSRRYPIIEIWLSSGQFQDVDINPIIDLSKK